MEQRYTDIQKTRKDASCCWFWFAKKREQPQASFPDSKDGKKKKYRAQSQLQLVLWDNNVVGLSFDGNPLAQEGIRLDPE